MDWERWFCPNQYCSVEFWMVQQSLHNRELWSITDRFYGGSFTVAAVVAMSMVVLVAQAPSGTKPSGKNALPPTTTNTDAAIK